MALKKKKQDEIFLDDNDFVSVDSEDEVSDVIETISTTTKKNSLKSIKKKKEESSLSDEPFIEFEEEDLSIDVENKKIKSKAKPFKYKDNRKNQAIGLNIFRFFVYIVILVIVSLGIKNTFFPSNNYTPAEVQQIARNAVNDTGFPLEQGSAFVTEFMRYYVVLDQKQNTKSALNKYYGGDSFLQTVSAPVNNTQNRYGEPIIYEKTAISENVAQYKVSVFVTPSITGENVKDPSHWLSFAVNVYFDNKTGKMSIHKDSPSLIPSYVISSTQNNPTDKPIGNGEKEESLNGEFTPLINGFIKAFIKSSVDSHNDVLQYVVKDPDASLLSGFNNTMELVSENDIVKSIYRSSTLNEWKVDLKIKLRDNTVTDKNSAASYTTRYVLTVIKDSNGKYFVSKFAPYIYETE